MRIERAKLGHSKVKEMLLESGEVYDQKSDILSEYAAAIGHVMGYLLGAGLLLGKSGFFT